MKNEEYTNEINNKNVCDEKGIEKAPDIIILNDEKKFKDCDGNVLEIETICVRDCKSIYFKVKDVSEALNIKHMQTLIIDKKQ